MNDNSTAQDRVRAYLDEIDRVNENTVSPQYADQIHGMNDILLLRSDLRALTEGDRTMTATTEVRGWIVVDKTTGAIDWDGELHPSEDAARESLNSNVRFNDPDWRPFEIYDVLPVLAALAVPATGETEWEYECKGYGATRLVYSSAEAEKWRARGYTVRKRTKIIQAGPWVVTQ